MTTTTHEHRASVVHWLRLRCDGTGAFACGVTGISFRDFAYDPNNATCKRCLKAAELRGELDEGDDE